MDNLNLGLFDISASSIFSGIIFGIIGWYLYKNGRSTNNVSIICIGLALMIYPYFTKGPWQDWGLGIALSGFAYYLLKIK